MGIYVLDADNVPVLAGMSWLDGQEVSFKTDTLKLFGKDGDEVNFVLRRAASGHRLLDLLQ